MNKYSFCIDYLHSLGLPMKICKKIFKKYAENEDAIGLLNYTLLADELLG